jgi:hypothetical protein
MPTAKSAPRKKKVAAKRSPARKPAGRVVRRATRAQPARRKAGSITGPVKLCPFCQSPNPITETKCAHCGAKLPKTAVAAPKAVVKGGVKASAAKPVTGAQPSQKRITALLLEIVPPVIGVLGLIWYFAVDSHPIVALIPAVLGVFGIGWLFAGQLRTGLILLIGMLIWDVFSIIAGNFTGGLTPYVTIPVNVLVIAISAIGLIGYMNKNTDAFGFF